MGERDSCQPCSKDGQNETWGCSLGGEALVTLLGELVKAGLVLLLCLLRVVVVGKRSLQAADDCANVRQPRRVSDGAPTDAQGDVSLIPQAAPFPMSLPSPAVASTVGKPLSGLNSVRCASDGVPLQSGARGQHLEDRAAAHPGRQRCQT